MTASFIGIYGGTFDPIHYGHLSAASEVQQSLALDKVRMLLSAQPPHRKQPILSASDRFSLLSLALSDYPGLLADDSEMKRAGPSYMVDSLLHYRQQLPTSSLVLILGMEAFNGLRSWYRWQEIIELAHIVITDRAGFDNQMEQTLAEYVDQFLTDDKSQLKQLTHGKIYFQPVKPIDISATQIRRLIKDRKPVKQLLPEVCVEEIKRQRFYT
ncbi:MAG: nicotinate-nucleotide adenylyltransferase [Cycloclasticus sp.]